MKTDEANLANTLDNISAQELRLIGGELTSQEIRTAKALLSWAAAHVRVAVIQSRRQGMLDAAAIAREKSARMPHYSNVELGYAQGRVEAAQAIEQAAGRVA